MPEGRIPIIGSSELEHLFQAHKPDIVVFDTVNYFVPPKSNMNSANDALGTLYPLKKLATKYKSTITLNTHVGKLAAAGNAGSHSVNFGVGSVAISGMCRSIWTLGRVKDENGKPTYIRALCPSKNNLVAGDLPCLLFELSPENGFLWAGLDYDLTATELYSSGEKSTRAPKKTEAKAFITALLSDSDKLSKVVAQEAIKAGISIETLNDAKKELNIISEKRGDAWWWLSKSANPLP